jgi:hypothetical protein
MIAFLGLRASTVVVAYLVGTIGFTLPIKASCSVDDGARVTRHCVGDQARCILEEQVKRHQIQDELLAAKFEHIWYGTKPPQDFRPRTLDEIISTLRRDTALLFYRLSNERNMDFESSGPIYLEDTKSICIWLIDATGLIAHSEIALDSVGVTWVLQADDHIRSALKNDDPSRGWRGPDPRKLVMATKTAPGPTAPQDPSLALKEASRLLLPDAIRERLQRFNRVIVVPSRNIGSIPYAALPFDDKQQLIDIASVVVMPSFGVLFDRAPNRGPRTKSLVVGDPEIANEDKLVRRRNFGPLPGAREEAQSVANMLGVQPILGRAATKNSVLQGVVKSDLIYLAMHGSFSDEHPNDRSFLVLSDGALTARMIAKLRLRTDDRRGPLVVMSACQTGLGKAFESGVIGLAKAWRYAGASAVVMTLWNVYDTETRDLMVDFIGQLRRGAPVDLALREAMLRTRANTKTAHPVYWAGFALYGGQSF